MQLPSSAGVKPMGEIIWRYSTTGCTDILLLQECVEQRLVEIHGSEAAKDRVMEAVNDRLLQLRPLHEAYFPSRGLDAPTMTAMERKRLMQFFAIALYSLVPDSITRLVAGEDALYSCAKPTRVGLLLPLCAPAEDEWDA
jgi:hypothetical protein